MQPPDDIRNPDGFSDRVGDALRAMPLERPGPDGWARMTAALERSRPGTPSVNARMGRNRLRWLSMVAVLALAAALPSLVHQPSPDHSSGAAAPDPQQILASNAAAPDESVQLDALQQESAQLEVLIAVTRDDAVLDSLDDGLRASLVRRVQNVDALLSDPETDSATQLPLWRERVLLLRRLAAMDGSERLLALNGEADNSRLVMAF